jgi:branched-chain amino acid transport system permease protein
MTLARSAWSARGITVLLGIAALAVVVPTVTGTQYYGSLAVTTCTLLILTLSMNLLVGTAGQFCLSHAAFYGIGAYATALLTLDAGWATWPAGAASLAIAGCVAAIVGYPLLRLKGYFLATASLAFSLFVEVLIRQSSGIFGGVNGIRDLPEPSLFGRALTGTAFLPVAVIACALVIAGLLNLRHSPLGRAMIATKDAEVAAEAAGVNAQAVRLSAFVLSSTLAALAGWLQASFFRSVDPHVFSVDLTFGWLFMIVIGGLGSVPGAIVATVILGVVPQVLGFANVQQVLVLGVLILLAVMFAPQGIAGVSKSVLRSWQTERRT